MIKKLGFRKLILILLSVTGVGIMSYLTYIHYANAKSFCDISEKISCDVVTTSIYSEIFGLPVSLLGLGFFAFIFFITVAKKGKGIYQIIFFATLLGLMPSLYLTLTEILFIKSYCILCETSKILMVLIGIVSFTGIKQKYSDTLRMSIPVVIAGVVFAFLTYFAQTANSTKEDYTKFVESLNSKNVVYYKSFRCSNCKRQELLLGKAYTKLNAVECHPEGPNSDVNRCFKMRISKTPTFIIEENGVEIKRLEGLQKLESLAQWAGVDLEKGK